MTVINEISSLGLLFVILQFGDKYGFCFLINDYNGPTSDIAPLYQSQIQTTILGVKTIYIKL